MIRCYTISVTTPGTIQNLLATIQALSAGAKVPQLTGVFSGPIDLRIKGIGFQADPSNTAAKNIYIGGPDLSVASRIGIASALAPGAYDPRWWELDCDNASLAELYFDVDLSATTKNLFVITKQ